MVLAGVETIKHYQTCFCDMRKKQAYPAYPVTYWDEIWIQGLDDPMCSKMFQVTLEWFKIIVSDCLPNLGGF